MRLVLFIQFPRIPTAKSFSDHRQSLAPPRQSPHAKTILHLQRLSPDPGPQVLPGRALSNDPGKYHRHQQRTCTGAAVRRKMLAIKVAELPCPLASEEIEIRIMNSKLKKVLGD